MEFLFKNLNKIEEFLNILKIEDHIISSNLANAETPFYKRLKMEIIKNQDIPLKVTNSKHISNKTSYFTYRIQQIKSTMQGSDKNNVDIQEELLALEKVALTYKTLLKFLQEKFSNLELVIRSGGNS